MSGCYSGFLELVKAVAPPNKVDSLLHPSTSSCIKPLPVYLKNVLDDSCKVVNFIKSCHTNSGIFSSSILLLHTEVRSLSRGKVVTHLFELRHEVQMFFENHPFQLLLKFNDHEWLQILAFLANVFFEIKQYKFNSSKQCIDKEESFVKKLFLEVVY